MLPNVKIHPEKIVEQLKDNLINVDANKFRDLPFIESAIAICSSTLLDLRKLDNQYNLREKEDKIHLVKITEPYVLSMCLFQYKLFEIEAIPSVMSIKGEGKYLKRMISDAQFLSHQTWNSIQITEVGRASG